jgi:hypothetical protein
MGMLEIREPFDSMRLEEVDSARYLFASGGAGNAQEEDLHVAYCESPSERYRDDIPGRGECEKVLRGG